MSCVIYYVALHTYLKRSEMLLIFARLQVMYNVFSIVPQAEITYKGLFFIQQYSTSL